MTKQIQKPVDDGTGGLNFQKPKTIERPSIDNVLKERQEFKADDGVEKIILCEVCQLLGCPWTERFKA